MPFPNGLNIDFEMRHDVASGHSAKRGSCNIPSDKQHPIGRMNLERNAETPQHARLRCGALASRKLSQIGRREYQLLFLISNSSSVDRES